jgi:hypothetical protein
MFNHLIRYKVSVKRLREVSNFAKDKGILRTSAYRLLDEGVLDYTVTDDIVYIILDDKAKGYNPQTQKQIFPQLSNYTRKLLTIDKDFSGLL